MHFSISVIDAVKYQAKQLNIESSGRTETLDECECASLRIISLVQYCLARKAEMTR